jgi:hypothetical protein
VANASASPHAFATARSISFASLSAASLSINDFHLIKVLGKGRWVYLATCKKTKKNKAIDGVSCFVAYYINLRDSFGKVYLVRPYKAPPTEVYAMKVLRKAEVLKRHQVDHTM